MEVSQPSDSGDVTFGVVECLPNEILEKILLFLRPYGDCKNAMLVCRRWNEVLRKAVRLRKTRFERCVDTDKLRWRYEKTYAKTEGSHLPAARLAHCAAFVDNAGEYAVYVFGGCTASHTAFHDLWTFQLSTNEWRRETARGVLPSPKAFATMCVHNDRLLLYGGWTETPPTLRHRPALFFNELHVYSFATRAWHAVTTEPRLPFVARHSASVVRVGGRDWLVVFGGRKFIPVDSSRSGGLSILDSGGTEEVSADLILIDLATFAFIVCSRDALSPQSTVSSTGAALNFTFNVEPRNGSRSTCVNVQPAGALGVPTAATPAKFRPAPLRLATWPLARFGQFQTTIDERYVLIVGGCGGANRVFDDEVWLLAFDAIDVARDSAQRITARFSFHRLTVRNIDAAPRHAFAKAASPIAWDVSNKRQVAFVSAPFAAQRGAVLMPSLMMHLLDVTSAPIDGVVSWRSVPIPAAESFTSELQRRKAHQASSERLDFELDPVVSEPILPNGKPLASFELCLPTLTYARNELVIFGGLRSEAVAWRFNVFPAAVPRAASNERDRDQLGDSRVVNDVIVISSS